MDQLLAKILVETENGKRFYRFANADHKSWLMPVTNMWTAMELYQPSGMKGKLVKRLLPWLHGLPVVRKVIHADSKSYQLNAELRQILEQLFGSTDLEFSIFCGTPCVHQKITLQIYQRNQILGYCKLTDSDAVAHLFQQENQLLMEFQQAALQAVPQPLFCRPLSNGIWTFVQTTTKTRQSRIVHTWTSLHEAFLERLYQCTQRELLFEESDYHKQLQELMDHKGWLPDEMPVKEIVKSYDHLMAKWRGKRVQFAACHADFTPWNMFVEQGKLFVFDWEYAQKTYPPGLDRYHFFTQTAFFAQHWSQKEIIHYMHADAGYWMERDTFIAYLLDMIARFTLREKRKVRGNIVPLMHLWGGLLTELNASRSEQKI